MFPVLPNMELVPANYVPSVTKYGVSSHMFMFLYVHQMWSYLPQNNTVCCMIAADTDKLNLIDGDIREAIC